MGGKVVACCVRLRRMKTPSLRRSGPLRASVLLLASILLSSACLAEPEPGGASAAARTVLVTGANRGIGLELARQYAADGWQVIGTARKPEEADALRESGAKVMQLDVTDQASVEQLAADLGDRPIDVLINNAGILPRMRALADVDFDDYNRVLAVNTVGPVRVTQALIPNLQAGDGKTIVNVTSQLGSITNSSGGFYGYRESKAALNMFTRSLAADLGPQGFVCIVIHPGWVRTDMGGANAPVLPKDSAAGIRRVVGGLSPEDNGTYWTFEGKTLPW